MEASYNKAFWHEIARPQVHGHDINCVCMIKGSGNHRFVSGADEKVARVFEAPLSFLKTLNYACAREQGSYENLDKEVQILGANMSALGLSQKPIYLNSKLGYLSLCISWGAGQTEFDAFLFVYSTCL